MAKPSLLLILALLLHFSSTFLEGTPISEKETFSLRERRNADNILPEAKYETYLRNGRQRRDLKGVEDFINKVFTKGGELFKGIMSAFSSPKSDGKQKK